MKVGFQVTLVALLLAISVRARSSSSEGLSGEAGQHLNDSLPFATMAGALA